MPEILTKKNLEDASKCFELKCSKCSMYGNEKMNCQEDLAQTALTLYGMVKRLNDERIAADQDCPICGKIFGHFDSCDWGNLLKQMEGQINA